MNLHVMTNLQCFFFSIVILQTWSIRNFSKPLLHKNAIDSSSCLPCFCLAGGWMDGWMPRLCCPLSLTTRWWVHGLDYHSKHL